MSKAQSAKELAETIPAWGCCELGCLFCPAAPPWQFGNDVDQNFLAFSADNPDIPRAEYEARENTPPQPSSPDP